MITHLSYSPFKCFVLAILNISYFFFNAHSYPCLLPLFPPLHFYKLFYFLSLLNKDKPNNSIIAVSKILHINLTISSSTTSKFTLLLEAEVSTYKLLERNVLFSW